ncbi:hypothetical protein JNUCC0626_05940 [Lentzea sp. JNUCC 0626]
MPAATPHAGPTDGLFSHPDLVVADGRPGTQPDVQWAHTSLFQEAPTS